MLRQLAIDDVALIQHLELNLDAGLTVITGETGAGKSILVDALSLVLGSRADVGLIRHGSERASVTALFHLPDPHPLRPWLQQRDLDHGADLLLRRVVRANGRSQAYINDTAVSLTALAEVGQGLVDLHGQHDHQSLLQEHTHRDLLDAQGGHLPLVHTVEQHFRDWQQAHERVGQLAAQARQAEERRAFLEFQIRELEELQPQAGELESLDRQRTRLKHAQRLQAGLQQVQHNLEHSALADLHGAAGELERLSRHDDALTALTESMRSLIYEGEELAQRLARHAESLELDPDALAQVEERFHRLRDVARKHRVEADALPALLLAWQEEWAGLDHLEQDQSHWVSQCDMLARRWQESADALTQARTQAARILDAGMVRQLEELVMPRTRFEVLMTTHSGTPRPQGQDDVTFLVSANPGQPPRPLSEVASGGELSRIMLALKTELAQADSVGTLIFDEVDVGVGGRVADAIGAKLAAVARDRQVLAITHQPQVAVWGHQHFKVTKHSDPQHTEVAVLRLDADARQEEIARMLAGERIGSAARENARQLLACAQTQEPLFPGS
ncbi:MAG: DNA repair protein RecN [Magnetococcus sp. WYHC-3]